jgi:hypothetical protein
MKTFTIENDNNITVHTSAAEAEAILDAERFASEEELASLAANWPAARLVEIFNSLPGVTEVRKFKDRATAVSRIWKAIQPLLDALSPETSEQSEAAPVAQNPQETVVESSADEPIVTESEAALVEPEPVAGPEADVPAPVAPQTPDVALETAPRTNDATPGADAPVSPSDEKLLRVLARAFEGLSPEQLEAKWSVLKNALATRKTAAIAPRQRVARAEANREGSKTSQVIAMLKREDGVTLEEIMTAMDWQKHTTRAMLSAGGSLVKKHGLTIVSEKVGEHRVYKIKA